MSYSFALSADFDAYWEITTTVFLKASHRNSHTTPQPVTPGTAIDYVIDLRADHYRFNVEVTLDTGAASTLHMPTTW